MSWIVPLSSFEATDSSRFGPKAATLARLGRAGLPIPGGFCLDADAYRQQIAALQLESSARDAFAADTVADARSHALRMKLELLQQPLLPDLREPLLTAWQRLIIGSHALGVVR
jgi:phosphoenolpyruvate synthase/pyruvate phosphate dikinase